MNIRGRAEYYGNKKIEFDREGIVLSEYSYHEAGTPWHYHENPYFMYVLKGDMTDVTRKGTTQVAPGGLMFYNWQEPHLNEKKSSSDGRGFHLELERKWFDNHKLDIDLWEGSQKVEYPRLHHLIGKIYAEFRMQDIYSNVSIELLLLQLCEQMDLPSNLNYKSPPMWIKHLQEIIHYSDEKLSLKYLSEQLGVHPVHISRSIPIYLNQSLGEYIRGQKIKRSVRYLVNQSLSLTQIAYECGFSDQSHFTKTFKNYFGCTPKIFRCQLSMSPSSTEC